METLKLKVISIEEKVSENRETGSPKYNHLRVSTPNIVDGVHIEGQEGGFIAWEESGLTGKPEFGYNLKEGDFIFGAFIERDTEEYSFEAKNLKTGKMETVTANSAKLLVRPSKGCTSITEADVRRAFKRADKILLADGAQEEAVAQPNEGVEA